MYLKDMVGKLAIRTAEAFNPEPFPPVHLDFSFPVFSPKPGSTRKYMDEPVKIINVKEDQVAIEEHGERKLLDRRYIDNHWIDYDKFLHPEKEEQEKLEDMAKEIKAAAEPLRRFLEKYYDPTVEVVVDTGVVTVKRGEYMTIFQKEEVPEENE